MNNFFTKEQLTTWIAGLKKSAERDENFSVSWFGPTKDTIVSIVGGWLEGFYPTDADLFCMSKSNPTFVMCVKIVVNRGPYVYTDFDILNMPVDINGEVEDTCIALEWDDEPENMAEFYMAEWERLLTTAIGSIEV